MNLFLRIRPMFRTLAIALIFALVCLGRASAQERSWEGTNGKVGSEVKLKLMPIGADWQVTDGSMIDGTHKYVIRRGLLGVAQGSGLSYNEGFHPNLRPYLQDRGLALDDQLQDGKGNRIVRVLNQPKHLFEVWEAPKPIPVAVNGQPRPAPDGPRQMAGPVGYGWVTSFEEGSLSGHIVMLWHKQVERGASTSYTAEVFDLKSERRPQPQPQPQAEPETGLKIALRNLDATAAVDRLRSAGFREVTLHRIPNAPAGMASKFANVQLRRVAVTQANPYGLAVDLYYYEARPAQELPAPTLPPLPLPPPLPMTPAPVAMPGQPVADQRNHWIHTVRSFVHVRGMIWEERETTTGKVCHPFEEKTRNAHYIELFDGSRNISVRLYATKMMLHGPQFDWHDYYAGQWQNSVARPAGPPPVLSGTVPAPASLPSRGDAPPPVVQLPPGPNNAPAGALSFAGKLTANDPIDRERQGSYSKVHTVQLQAGQDYVIDLASLRGPEFFDVYLRLEDANGRTLAQDDDGGGDLNARIGYRPTASGSYRLVVTSFASGATGSYTLNVNVGVPQAREEGPPLFPGQGPPPIDQLPPGFPGR